MLVGLIGPPNQIPISYMVFLENLGLIQDFELPICMFFGMHHMIYSNHAHIYTKLATNIRHTISSSMWF